MDDLEFPDGVMAVLDLIRGKEFAGQTLNAGKYMPTDNYGQLAKKPFALVVGEGGTPGYVDQVERLRVEVYAPFDEALEIAKEIKKQIVGTGINTSAGFLDKIKADQVPTDVPYSGDLSKATLLLSITSRPKD
ncbi:hypothetical protein [Glutamicibacter creatinolyticus]|uniref:hypothetical protein n=1 Tax=Glutamicibacter creatinolyticus TaxID=162496 RepID=UPI003216B0EF